MPLLLLGENMLGARGAARYRGTYRQAPAHSDSLPEDSEYNTLFRWYCDAEYEPGGILDVERLRRLLNLLKREPHGKGFEIIEACHANESPNVGGELLGYDLSLHWSYSLLSWGLDLDKAQHATQIPAAVRSLIALTEAHFKPMLNEQGLFSDEHCAAFCLRVMSALQTLSPGLWENGAAFDFAVVAVFKVSGDAVAPS